MFENRLNDRLIHLIKFLKDSHFLGWQVFNCSGIDPTETVYDEDGIIVCVSYYYGYIEIFGLSDRDYRSLIVKKDVIDHVSQRL